MPSGHYGKVAVDGVQVVKSSVVLILEMAVQSEFEIKMSNPNDRGNNNPPGLEIHWFIFCYLALVYKKTRFFSLG